MDIFAKCVQVSLSNGLTRNVSVACAVQCLKPIFSNMTEGEIERELFSGNRFETGSADYRVMPL